MNKQENMFECLNIFIKKLFEKEYKDAYDSLVLASGYITPKRSLYGGASIMSSLKKTEVSKELSKYKNSLDDSNFDVRAGLIKIHSKILEAI